MKQLFEEPFGNTKVVLEYDEENGWIYADWIGVHSLPSIRKGTGAIVALFEQTGCSKYLSDNTHIVGSYDNATDYLVNVFTPQAMAAGMRFVAHVLAPGIYAQQSIYNIRAQLPDNLEMQLFDDIEKARAWLKTK